MTIKFAVNKNFQELGQNVVFQKNVVNIRMLLSYEMSESEKYTFLNC